MTVIIGSVGRYPFIPYDSTYPELFQAEKERIREVLGKRVTIEHVGSTSVPGLGGKGKDEYKNIKSPLIKELIEKALKGGDSE